MRHNRIQLNTLAHPVHTLFELDNPIARAHDQILQLAYLTGCPKTTIEDLTQELAQASCTLDLGTIRLLIRLQTLPVYPGGFDMIVRIIVQYHEAHFAAFIEQHTLDHSIAPTALPLRKPSIVHL